MTPLFDNLKTAINELIKYILFEFVSVATKLKHSDADNCKKSYSGLVQNVFLPVIRKPKKDVQSSSKIKSGILNKVDPVAANINLKNIQTTKMKSGGST